MVIRRIITLFGIIYRESSITPNTVLNEVIGLVISIIMLMGIAMIAPLFRSIKKSEQELKIYSENLEKLVDQRTAQMIQSSKLVSLGTFAGGIAHDFNNILTSIMGYAEILKMRFSDTS